MSRTVCTYPIVAAILKADDILGLNRTWQPVNPTQVRYLENFHTPQVSEVSRIPEIQSVIALSAEEINAWLAERGFDIKLDPFADEHSFGTASILDILVSWLKEGTPTPITLANQGGSVEGVFLEDGVGFVESSGLGIVANIQTLSGDVVSITRCDEVSDGLVLMDLVTNETPSPLPSYDYGGIVFPMVDLDDKPNLSWLKGMRTVSQNGEPFVIAQALQQTKFKMNQHGARAKSAVAMEFALECYVVPVPPLVIDGPFLIWISRPGLSKPFFVGHITPENFKNPGSLDNM